MFVVVVDVGDVRVHVHARRMAMHVRVRFGWIAFRVRMLMVFVRDVRVIGKRAIAVGQGSLILTSSNSAGESWGYANPNLPTEVKASWDFHGVHCLKAERTAEAFARVFAGILDRAIDLEPLGRRASAVIWRDFHLDAILPRIEQALASRLRHIVGVDLSPAMIAEAKRRCADIANVSFAVCNGREFPQLAATGFDLILAIDSFPCVSAVAPEIAERYIHDAARMLRPGGTLAIFNYSYRGDLAADRADIARCAGAAGLRVLRNGTRDLGLWDGTSFLLIAPPRRE